MDLARVKSEAPVHKFIIKNLNQTMNFQSTNRLTLGHIHTTFETKAK